MNDDYCISRNAGPSLWYLTDDGVLYRLDIAQPPTGHATIVADNRQKAIARALIKTAERVLEVDEVGEQLDGWAALGERLA